MCVHNPNNLLNLKHKTIDDFGVFVAILNSASLLSQDTLILAMQLRIIFIQ